jgi:hypothetical protein
MKETVKQGGLERLGGQPVPLDVVEDESRGLGGKVVARNNEAAILTGSFIYTAAQRWLQNSGSDKQALSSDKNSNSVCSGQTIGLADRNICSLGKLLVLNGLHAGSMTFGFNGALNVLLHSSGKSNLCLAGLKLKARLMCRIKKSFISKKTSHHQTMVRRTPY